MGSNFKTSRTPKSWVNRGLVTAKALKLAIKMLIADHEAKLVLLRRKPTKVELEEKVEMCALAVALVAEVASGNPMAEEHLEKERPA